jgi:hypothetical protein
MPKNASSGSSVFHLMAFAFAVRFAAGNCICNLLERMRLQIFRVDIFSFSSNFSDVL